MHQPDLHPEEKRDILSKALISPEAAPRYVPGQEERRVDELLDVQYTEPYANQSRLASIARRVLTATTRYQPKEPEPIPRPFLDESQARQQARITEELNHSRELLRRNLLFGVDDIVVDQFLGLRAEESILPNTIRQAHRQAEAAQEKEISFLSWMADIATDEQLINVWQWHDAYLRERDEDPEFQERIARIKAEYGQGLEKAIAAGLLPPEVAIDKVQLDSLSFRHGSPFSPVLASAQAYVDHDVREIQLREGTNDFTLYHEISHTLTGGLHPAFDEGLTDMMAATIYNGVREDARDHVDPHEHAYADQIATLEALGRIIGSPSVMYEFAQVGSGSDKIYNSVALLRHVDAKIGLPLMSGLLGHLNDYMEGQETILDTTTWKLVSHLAMRQWVEFIEAMMRDDNGHITTNIGRILKRIITPATVERYGEPLAHQGLQVIMKAAQFQHELDIATTKE